MKVCYAKVHDLCYEEIFQYVYLNISNSEDCKNWSALYLYCIVLLFFIKEMVDCDFIF